MKVDGSIKSLIQGVSQQPARTRIPGQNTLQENFSSDPVEGLKRRPPTELIASLFSSASTQQFYDYELQGKRYIVAMGTGEIRVFDSTTGAEKTVNADPAALAYLDGNQLVSATLDSDTFIANTAKVCTMLPDVKDYGKRGSVVYILGGNYSKTFKIEVTATHSGGGVGNITGTYTTPNGSTPTHIDNIKTTYIAEQLFNSLTSSTNAVITALAAARVIMVQYMEGWTVANTCTPTAPCSARIATAGTRQTQITTQLNLALAGTPEPHAALVTIINQIKAAMAISVRLAGSEITTAMLNTFDTEVNTYSEMYTASVVNGVFVQRKDDHLYISSTNPNVTVTVQTSDDMYDTLMRYVNNEAKTTANVPKYAPQGYVISIKTGSNADASYLYLEFRVKPDEGETVATGAGFGRDGTWFETVAPNLKYLLDANTMPHVLEYDADTDEFTFKQGEWLGRQVGDEDSNPDPSFVGKTIKYLSYFQGRLVMLAGIACIMSRTNDAFDYFNKSATTIVDGDPIDISSTVKNSSDFRAAIPFNRDLIVFADNAQFIVFGRTSLTPRNASLVLTTAFESELRASPVVAGRNIFFAINYGNFTGIREFYSEGSEDINDARPITEHVLKYMPGKIGQMASSSNFNMLLVRTDTSSTRIFVYEYIWSNQTKLQSSWSTWIFPNPLRHYFLLESVIYMVAQIGNEYVLERLDLDTQMEDDLNYQVHLDRKSSDIAVGKTIQLPYNDAIDIDNMIFVQGTGCLVPGLRAEVADYDPVTKTVTFKRDHDGGVIHFGFKYKSRIMPTIPFVKDEDGVKIGTGRLVITKFLLNYRQSAEMYATVTSPYRDPDTISFSGRIANDPRSVVGVAPIQSGSWIIPFRENADNAELEIFTDQETPLTIMDIEWEGQYTKKGTRIPQGD